MQMEIQEEKKNVLQERTEVRFVAVHEGECTPGRHAVAEELGKKYGVKRELVIIDALESQYGIGDYLLKRNGYKEEKAEEEAAE